jgi:hypothetical protein
MTDFLLYGRILSSRIGKGQVNFFCPLARRVQDLLTTLKNVQAPTKDAPGECYLLISSTLVIAFAMLSLLSSLSF